MRCKTKKSWVKPLLSKMGPVNKLTQGIKKTGISDGWTDCNGQGLQTCSAGACPS